MRTAPAMTVKIATLAASAFALGVLGPDRAFGVEAPPDPSHGNVVYIVPSTSAAPTRTPPSVPSDSGTSLLAAVVVAAAAGSLLTELATSRRTRRQSRTPTSTSPAGREVSTRTLPREARGAVPGSHPDASRDDAAGGQSRPSDRRRRTPDSTATAPAAWGRTELMDDAGRPTNELTPLVTAPTMLWQQLR